MLCGVLGQGPQYVCGGALDLICFCPPFWLGLCGEAQSSDPPMAVSQEHCGDYHRLPDYAEDSPPEEEEQLLVHVTEGLKGTLQEALGPWVGWGGEGRVGWGGEGRSRHGGHTALALLFFFPRFLASHQESRQLLHQNILCGSFEAVH